jgi:hypothetical protein
MPELFSLLLVTIWFYQSLPLFIYDFAFFMVPNNLKWKSFSKGHPMSDNAIKDVFDKSASATKALPNVRYANTNAQRMTLVTYRKRQMLFSSEEDALTVVSLMIEGCFSIP